MLTTCADHQHDPSHDEREQQPRVEPRQQAAGFETLAGVRGAAGDGLARRGRRADHGLPISSRWGRALGRQASVRACDPELADPYGRHLKIGCGRAAGALDYKRVTIFKFR